MVIMPEALRPLTKKVGVPVTPAIVPRRATALTGAKLNRDERAGSTVALVNRR